MKARIKATGEVVRVWMPAGGSKYIELLPKNSLYIPREWYPDNLDFNVLGEELTKTIADQIEESMRQIDWEQREWNAAVAIMGSVLVSSKNIENILKAKSRKEAGAEECVARFVIDMAKALVAEYRKGE